MEFLRSTIGRIDGPTQVAPAALHANVGLVYAPGFVGRLEMPPDALLQFWTVPLHPAPHGRMVGLQPALVYSSSTSRSDSEYRKYQRTAQRIRTGSVCRDLKIAGRVAVFGVPSGYQPPLRPFATHPHNR
jgi:hypothetical protein